METLAQLFDKYGPLGMTVIVLAGLLVFFFWKVLPKLNETWAQQIQHERESHAIIAEAEREVFKQAMGSIGQRLDATERTQAERHGQVMGRFDKLEDKIDRIHPKDKKAT